MRVITIFLCLAFCGISNLVKAQYPTDSAQFTLVTASPGEETYAIFGHSALRVTDKRQGYDVVFNYGMFDFRNEYFYLKFVTGKLMYFLAVMDYPTFIESYRESGQAIYLQNLHLSNKEKFTLFNNLQNNNLEENRYYRYDFFRDNCATRIRDVIATSVDGTLTFDTAYVPKRESFRYLYESCLQSQPWTFFGLNLIMGKSSDSVASISDYMYLPVHLKNLFASAKIVSGSGSRPLASAPTMLFASTIVFEKPGFFASPTFIMSILFVCVLLFSVWEYRTKRHFKWFDVFLFLITGLLGVLIVWLWSSSLHIYLHSNLNVIWASPLNVLGALGLIIWTNKRWLRLYFAVYAATVLLFIAVSFFTTQQFQFASYFLMGIMVVRALRVWLGR